MSIVLRTGRNKRLVLEKTESTTMLYIIHVIRHMEFKRSISLNKLLEYVNNNREEKKLLKFSKVRITICVFMLAYFDILRVYQNKRYRNVYPGKNFPPQKIIYMVNNSMKKGDILNMLQEAKKII